MPGLLGSVGRGGKNNKPDVKIVQEMLNLDLPAGIDVLDVDGIAGPVTAAAISAYQRANVPALRLSPTGLVAPNDATWQKLSQTARTAAAGPRIVAAPAPVGAWPAKFTFDEFWNFTEPLEGGAAADCMFLVQDLQVATGMGITFSNAANKAAGLAMAQRLEWLHKIAGRPCTPAEIEADYNEVLKHEDMGLAGPGRLAQWQALTNCRITEEGLKRGVRAKVLSNINFVKTQRKDAKYLGDFDSFPADAQLCIISLTWAVGNEFGYPRFCAACRAGNWFEAAKECGFKDKLNTLPRRQAQQETMMRNAGCTARGIGDPDTLQFPTALSLPSEGRTGFRESHQISLG